ncbi:alpha/beta fold hydrolase [Sediminitomix flava]|uniref:Pimeloyl-ACP methyl ester carboxylesterase n=1 Tax=Sediminitomix flava TaxID=379075 RepID=A0A315ZIW9_SEDFL|nr:alpha/beta hydrolase [Sediminitomix flava]PWJ44768.1 pimeloyl-ACP methyl ester carboxylesterase [Sediminitomix flava]
MPKRYINDIDLYYEEYGSGEPLLLIHGLGSCSGDWDYQVSDFRHHYRLIIPDLRGHGNSSKPKTPYSMRLFAQDIISLIEQLNLEKVNLVGLSLGGMISFQIAALRPDLVKSMVVVNSTPSFKPSTFREQYSLWLRLSILRLFGLRYASRLVAVRMFPKPEHVALKQRVYRRLINNDTHAYKNSIRAIVRWKLSDEQLRHMHLPILIVTGDRDIYSVAYKEAYTTKLPNAKLVVIPDSGHGTPHDQPLLFNKEVKDFLEKPKVSTSVAS